MIAAGLADVQARLPSGLRVRAGGADDLERVTDFLNEFARPAQRTTIETVRRFEAHNPQPNRLVLIVEDAAGKLVAVGQVSDGGLFAQKDGSHSGGVRVRPEQQRRGIGTALLERLEAHARSKRASKVNAVVRGDEPEGARFAERRGYVERNRRYNSYLDVQAFDHSRFEDDEAIARRAGVRLASFRELAAERASDPDAFQREVYEFGRTIAADVPRPEPFEMPPYEAIRDIFFGTEDAFDRDATIVAVRDGRIVAETITEQRTPGIAYTDLTGTDREWRGKGLALALKLRALRALKEQGARLFGTTNDEANAAMRGINAKLGYVADPPLIEVQKPLA